MLNMRSFNIAKHDPELIERIQRTDKYVLGKWAIACIKRAMPLFHKAYPNNDMPELAISRLSNWMNNKLKMSEARSYCFDLLSFARKIEAKDKANALFIRGCSHMLATCHVKTHSEGAGMYVIAMIKEMNKTDDQVYTMMEEERAWQIKELDRLMG